MMGMFRPEFVEAAKVARAPVQPGAKAAPLTPEAREALRRLDTLSQIRRLANIRRPVSKGMIPKNSGARGLPIANIVKAVSLHFEVSVVDLLSHRRDRAIVRPRQIVMWLAKRLTVRSLPDIGRQIGGRDHTTILYGVRKIEELRGSSAWFRSETDELLQLLTPTPATETSAVEAELGRVE